MLSVVTPAANRRLTTLENLKGELGITGSAEDARLGLLIDRASALIARHCRQPFAFQAYLETFECPRGRVLVLSRVPVISAVIAVDGADLVEGDWRLDAELGHLARVTGALDVDWCGGAAAVAYGAGYVLPGEPDQAGVPRLPADVEHACITLASALRAGGRRDPMLRSETTEGIGSQSYIATADMSAMPPQVVDALRGFLPSGVS